MPTRQTIYEETDIWLVGLTLPTFWRPSTATVRIGDRVENGLHLLQVWVIRPMGGEEVLVLYPQDGYWRMRPDGAGRAWRRPRSARRSWSARSRSTGRPIVRIKEIAFDPKARTFTLHFERGGSATLRMAHLDEHRHALDVAFDKPVAGRPFAMLRSMYVTEFNNDCRAHRGAREGRQGLAGKPIMDFKSATATDIWMGRTTISQHNTSSPDIVFNGFAGAPRP